MTNLYKIINSNLAAVANMANDDHGKSTISCLHNIQKSAIVILIITAMCINDKNIKQTCGKFDINSWILASLAADMTSSMESGLSRPYMILSLILQSNKIGSWLTTLIK